MLCREGNAGSAHASSSGRLLPALGLAAVVCTISVLALPASAAGKVDARPAAPAPNAAAGAPRESDAQPAGTPAGTPAPAASPGYPVDTRAPRDFFTEALLHTLKRESSATVACRLLSLTDIFPQAHDPDTFYDAACEVFEVIAGHPDGTPLHFIWQVERGNRMPPPQSELLVYLKARKKPLDGPPALDWVALDSGVMRYTEALKDKIHHKKSSRRAASH